MSTSNLDKPRITPFESITLRMEDRTNMGANYVYSPGTSIKDTFRLMEDQIYTAVFMDVDDTSNDLVALSVATKNKAYTKGTPIIGVLLESFYYPNVESRVLVRGIVPMQVKTAVSPGELVSPNIGVGNGDKYKVKKAESGDWAFGMALTEGKVDNDWIAVLLCRGQKVKA